VALSHDNLENHIKLNFGLMQHHKYSHYDLEHMMPWERAVYVALLMNYLKEEEEKRKSEARK
jgi:hypothetical protein